jgi:hypothetical protein
VLSGSADRPLSSSALPQAPDCTDGTPRLHFMLCPSTDGMLLAVDVHSCMNCSNPSGLPFCSAFGGSLLQVYAIRVLAKGHIVWDCNK